MIAENINKTACLVERLTTHEASQKNFRR